MALLHSVRHVSRSSMKLHFLLFFFLSLRIVNISHPANYNSKQTSGTRSDRRLASRVFSRTDGRTERRKDGWTDGQINLPVARSCFELFAWKLDHSLISKLYIWSITCTSSINTFSPLIIHPVLSVCLSITNRCYLFVSWMIKSCFIIGTRHPRFLTDKESWNR